ncbi:carboxypeptidase-like regulatory domain-containing protein [Aeromicrobium sp. Root236]|uniref:carboxypeptidase-like regulatory domain-containing protein n=1 Tax=Aeromicrobium sp. Root236 TaxID=1736498 RepID=UPI0009E821C6|nr:carboxypeptidase-like regulatory domain-containing protein [Aeromicrobium sp. Root236]
MPTSTTLDRPASRTTRLASMVVALLVALAGLVAVAQPAAAAGATLTGRVVTTDGTPIDRMQVYINTGGGGQIQALTGTDGTYKLQGVPAGTVDVFVYDPYITYNDGPWKHLTQLTDGETRAVADFALALRDNSMFDVKLFGHVYDASGKPARGVAVMAKSTADNQTGGLAITDRNGLFLMYSSTGVFGAPPPAPGTYKLQYQDGFVANPIDPSFDPFDTFGYGLRYSGDQPTLARATTVTVDSGSHDVGAVTVTRNGGISGALTSTVPITNRTVTFYNSDGEQAAIVPNANPDGTYETVSLRPGTYYVRFSSSDGGGSKFIRAFWHDSASLADATPVVVKSGASTAGVSQVLSDQLTAYVTPTISGSPVVGATLTASPGSWSLNATTEFSYEWFAGGVHAGTGKTYKPVTADVGKALTVEVTAIALDKSGTETSTATTAVKRSSKVTASGSYSRSKKRLTLTVRVTVPGVTSPGGTVTVKEGTHTIKARVALRSGKAVITISKPRTGRKHYYRLSYSGSNTIAAATGSTSYYVPR